MNRLVYVFPGQASQYVGMGQELAAKYEEAAAVFAEADAILGWPLSRLCFSGPADELNWTENTQPAVLTVSVACYRVLKACGLRPQVVLGHSLGEYSALVAAGSFSFSQALGLVARRARLMAEAVPQGQGGMVAILGLTAEQVVALCREVRDGIAEAANFNAPGQVVVAGDRAGLAAITQLAKASGAKKVIPLPVSGPFHSSLMEPAARQLAEELLEIDIAAPRVPVISNVTADYLTTATAVRESLLQQMVSPVRWQESIKRLLAEGYQTFVEVGPGNILSGLIKRMGKQLNIYQVGDSSSLKKTLAILQEAK
ncbi:MAG: ACP S-malonyltransferase [Clostridia bacterium]|nr:ACP S-malonyltransferase [Clostridia bacterium]